MGNDAIDFFSAEKQKLIFMTEYKKEYLLFVQTLELEHKQKKAQIKMVEKRLNLAKKTYAY